MKAKELDVIIKKMDEHKPKWFASHEKSDSEEFGAIRNTLRLQDGVLAELKRNHDMLLKMQTEYHEKTIPVFEYLNEITVGRKIRNDYYNFWTTIAKGFLIASSIVGVLWAFFKFLVFNAK